MKKRELAVILCIVLACLAGLGYMRWRAKQKKEDTILIVYHDRAVQSFDANTDGLYHGEGDYGSLDVEVKDGRWHVINEICPNHTCAKMGWKTPEDYFPIQCIPNGITILPASWIEEK